MEKDNKLWLIAVIVAVFLLVLIAAFAQQGPKGDSLRSLPSVAYGETEWIHAQLMWDKPQAAPGYRIVVYEIEMAWGVFQERRHRHTTSGTSKGRMTDNQLGGLKTVLLRPADLPWFCFRVRPVGYQDEQFIVYGKWSEWSQTVE